MRHLNMSSHMIDSTRSIIGSVPPLASARDRRDGSRKNPNRKRGKSSPHMLVEIPTDPSVTVNSLLGPEMIGPSLLTIEQALSKGRHKANQTHRNDPWKVNQILLCGPPSDRI
jgi:hypothetical protein